MNLQHAIFVLHYFFIEYSLTFLSATQLIGIFFPVFLCLHHTVLPLRRQENHTAYSFWSPKRTVILARFL